MNIQSIKNLIVKFKKAFSSSHSCHHNNSFSCSSGGTFPEITIDRDTLTITEMVVQNDNEAKVATTNAIPMSGVSLVAIFSNSLSGVSDVSGWTSHITLKTNSGNNIPITITKVEANDNQIRITPQGVP